MKGPVEKQVVQEKNAASKEVSIAEAMLMINGTVDDACQTLKAQTKQMQSIILELDARLKASGERLTTLEKEMAQLRSAATESKTESGLIPPEAVTQET